MRQARAGAAAVSRSCCCCGGGGHRVGPASAQVRASMLHSQRERWGWTAAAPPAARGATPPWAVQRWRQRRRRRQLAQDPRLHPQARRPAAAVPEGARSGVQRGAGERQHAAREGLTAPVLAGLRLGVGGALTQDTCTCRRPCAAPRRVPRCCTAWHFMVGVFPAPCRLLPGCTAKGARRCSRRKA